MRHEHLLGHRAKQLRWTCVGHLQRGSAGAWWFQTLGFFHVLGCVPEKRSHSDRPHDTTDQAYPQGRGTVVRGPRRSERKVQFVGADTARSDGVESLPVVLSPRQHDGQELRDVSGARGPLLVARAPPSVFGVPDRWWGTVAARAEVEGDSASHVGARGLDGRRGYVVRREGLASVLGEGVQLLEIYCTVFPPILVPWSLKLSTRARDIPYVKLDKDKDRNVSPRLLPPERK